MGRSIRTDTIMKGVRWIIFVLLLFMAVLMITNIIYPVVEQNVFNSIVF